MLQPVFHTTALFSLSAKNAEIQIVATSRSIVLDVQAEAFDVDGRCRKQSTLAQFSLADARQLYGLLGNALNATDKVDDPRQTCLWSEVTVRDVASRMWRGRLA